MSTKIIKIIKKKLRNPYRGLFGPPPPAPPSSKEGQGKYEYRSTKFETNPDVKLKGPGKQLKSWRF